MTSDMLTAAQQDYLEVIFRIGREKDESEVRITDIARELGTRLPTVTRTVRRIAIKGLLDHNHGGTVRLTAEGRRVAGEILHLHEDILIFLSRILGVDMRTARHDACQIEHSCSPKTAQRLHEFLEYYQGLNVEKRRVIDEFGSKSGRSANKFKNLPKHKVDGWRS